MSRLPSRPQFVPGEGRHPALTLVGVVRLLQLGHAHPSLAQRVSLLMDHMEDIQVTKGQAAPAGTRPPQPSAAGQPAHGPYGGYQGN